MSNRNLEGLSERERACLAHLEEAKRLGVSFSRYCREKELSLHQWTWIKRALVRKGVISERRRVEESKAAGGLRRCALPRPRRRADDSDEDGMSDSPSIGLDDRVRELSGSLLDVGVDVGRAA